MARFIISRHNKQQNQQQQAFTVALLALLKEDEHHLWLAVDSLNNLAAACETFAFLSGKIS